MKQHKNFSKAFAMLLAAALSGSILVSPVMADSVDSEQSESSSDSAVSDNINTENSDEDSKSSYEDKENEYYENVIEEQTDTTEAGDQEGEDGFKIIDGELIQYDGEDQNIIIPAGVTKIGKGVFSYNQLKYHITSIQLPDGLKYIDAEAFDSQTDLYQINLPESLIEIGDMAFRNCLSLSKINIPKSLEKIGSYVFNSSGLRSISITNPNAELGEYCFSDCIQLSDVNLPDNLKSIPKGLLSNTDISKILLPSAVETIEEEAFRDCKSLESISFPDSLSRIEENAFKNCPKLQIINFSGDESQWRAIEISDGNEVIENTNIVFEKSVSVSPELSVNESESTDSEKALQIDFPGDTKELESLALQVSQNGSDFIDLEHVSLDSSKAAWEIKINAETVIPDTQDEGFRNLRAKAILSDNATLYSNIVQVNFKNSHSKSNDFVIRNGILTSYEGKDENIVVPDGVTKLSSSVFSYRRLGYKIKSVVLPESLEIIDLWAFESQDEMTNINFPGGLEKIEQYAFRNCENLEEVLLSGTVTYIGESAFDNAGIKQITGLNPNTKYGQYVFSNTPNLKKIELPEGMKVIPTGYLNHSGIENIILPETINSIELNSFNNCRKLETILVPASLTKVGKNAFAECYSLNKVTYLGDQAQWKKIDISEGNGEFTKANRILPSGKYDYNDLHLYVHNAIQPTDDKILTIDYSGNLADLSQLDIQYTQDRLNYKDLLSIELNASQFPLDVQIDADQVMYKSYNYQEIRLRLKAVYKNGKTDTSRVYDANFTRNKVDKDFKVVRGVVVSYSGDKRDLEIPEGVTRIAPYAFSKDELGYELNSVKFPDSLKYIDTAAFESQHELKDFVLPDNLDTIGDYAFRNCSSIKEITFPLKIQKIGSYAFSNTGLEKISVPEGYYKKTFGEYLFSDNIHLKELNIDGMTYSLPKGLAAGSGLEYIKIPNTISNITYGSFENCTNLKKIYIPKSVKNIQMNAFKNCNSLRNVEYDGSEAQWKKINIYNGESGNQALLDASVSYLDYQVETPGISSSIASYQFPYERDIITTYSGDVDDLDSLVLQIATSGTNPKFTDYKVADLENISFPWTVDIKSKDLLDGKSRTELRWFRIKAVGKDQEIKYSQTIELGFGLDDQSFIEKNYIIKDNTLIEYRGEDPVVEIPDGVERISYSAFQSRYKWELITKVNCPESLKYIDSRAFYGCQNLQSINLSDKLLEIGNQAFESCPKLGKISIPASVKKIGDYAFCRTGLESIDFHCSEANLGGHIFESSTKLKNLNLSEKMSEIPYAFLSDSSLKTLQLPDSLIKINRSAFSKCTNLTDIYFPNTLTTISGYAFSSCDKIQNIVYDGSKYQWKNIIIDAGNESLFKANIDYLVNPVEVPGIEVVDAELETSSKTVTVNYPGDISDLLLLSLEISNNGADFTELYSADLNSFENPWTKMVEARTILTPEEDNGSRYFRVKAVGIKGETKYSNLLKADFVLDNESLIEKYFEISNGTLIRYKGKEKDVIVPAGVTKIADEAFTYSAIGQKITSVVLPDTVTSIGNSAFEGQSDLTEINLPGSITEIGRRAFAGCSSLKGLTLSESVQSVGEEAWAGTGIESLTVLNPNTAFGNFAFSYNGSLKEISLPDGMAVIPEGFVKGSAVTEIELPDTVETIKSQAFYDCKEMTSIVIPESLKTVERDAFGNCDNLNWVEYTGTRTSWNQIGIESGNEPLTEASIDYVGSYLSDPVLTIDNPDEATPSKDMTIEYPGSLKNIASITLQVSENGNEYNDLMQADLNGAALPWNTTVLADEVLRETQWKADRYFRVKVTGVDGNEAFSTAEKAVFDRTQYQLKVSTGELNGTSGLIFEAELPDNQSRDIFDINIYESVNGSSYKELYPNSSASGCPADGCWKKFVVDLKDTIPFAEAEKECSFKAILTMRDGSRIYLEPTEFTVPRLPLTSLDKLFTVSGEGNNIQIECSPENWDETIASGYTVSVSDAEDKEIYTDSFTGLKSHLIRDVNQSYDPLEAKVKITVLMKDGTEETETVNIPLDAKERPQIEDLDFGKTEFSVPLNSEFQLEPVKIPEEAAGEIRYESADPKIVSVNDIGVVKGLKRGTTEITASFGEGKTKTLKVTVTNPEKFKDVAETSWYYSTIAEVSRKGIMTGLNDEEFGPDETMTRGMAAVVLYRLAGAPNPQTKPAFKDVPAGAYYYQAVAWCTQMGIVSGYDKDTFGPDDPITREQICVVIRNYLKVQGADVNKKADLKKFKDYNKVSPYAVSAMEYCVSQGIISGAENGTMLNPINLATRAECAKMFLLTSNIQ